MKIIIIILMSIFCLCACTKEEYMIDTYIPDMDNYVELEYDNVFVGLSVAEFVEAMDNKKTMVVYIGYDLCPNCQEIINPLAKVANDLNAKVYYIDTNSERYPFGQDEEDVLMDVLKGVLLTNEQHVKTIYAPHVFSVVDGTIVSSIVGIPDDNVEYIYNGYYKLFKDVY